MASAAVVVKHHVHSQNKAGLCGNCVKLIVAVISSSGSSSQTTYLQSLYKFAEISPQVVRKYLYSLIQIFHIFLKLQNSAALLYIFPRRVNNLYPLLYAESDVCDFVTPRKIKNAFICEALEVTIFPVAVWFVGCFFQTQF